MPDPRIEYFQMEGEKVLQFLHGEFGKLQTGRANASLIEHVEVDAYSQRMPLKGLATISVQDARTIIVQPWDRSVLQSIEKALHLANLGVNPVNDGTLIRLSLPPMTEERREQLKKVVHKLSEDARVALRHHRQKVHDELKGEKDDDVRETLKMHLEKEVEKINAKIEESREKKEEEVMRV